MAEDKTDGITDSKDMNWSKLQKMVENRGFPCCRAWDCRVRHNLAIKQHIYN